MRRPICWRIAYSWWLMRRILTILKQNWRQYSRGIRDSGPTSQLTLRCRKTQMLMFQNSQVIWFSKILKSLKIQGKSLKSKRKSWFVKNVNKFKKDWLIFKFKWWIQLYGLLFNTKSRLNYYFCTKKSSSFSWQKKSKIYVNPQKWCKVLERKELPY